ncbi:BglG family transcription antiterminator [Enterocloster bolteae]|uniref:BglG family transcription antiterminator n=1 Tax=Enterocloster bolteae TaxID=208479 RepID=UPI00210A8927|nr:PTS sugar transporter subunit IIA [Enterocloster bolteae]MCQ5143866.1 PTS sugar transporter subunit IIA [Enterocloster bolteae]
MNKRTKDIVGELIRTDQILTISDLSTHFGVSERTIRNDLNNINDWLGQNGLSLIKLGSNGRIEYRPEIEEVQKFVLENDFYSYKLSKEERKLIMAAILISSSEYTTLAKIADILFVSRVTVINDLDDVKRFISQEKLKVISHSNKGLRVEGEESRKRRMLLLMNRPQREFGQMDFAGNTLNRLMGIEGEEQEIIRKIINEQEHANNSFMTDDSFHELTLYLSILLKRVRQGEFVEKQDISHNLRYPMAAGILKYLCQYCGVTVTEDEVQYLSMVLSGLRYLKKDDFNGDIVKTQLITRQFIEAVSRTLELDFNNDYVFYENLSNHLQSIFESSDLSFKENPVLRQILDKNKQIEYAVDENRAIVEKYIHRPLSPVELTYIAIHICAAIERKKNKEVAFHVILVCHGGIGTSQLLLERLKKHFNFQIVDIMSAHEVGRIRKGQADMVISTVRLSDCEIDNVVVTPSLDDTDYLKVGHLIDDLRSRKNLPPRLEKKKITAKSLLNRLKPVIRQYKEQDVELLLKKVEEEVNQYFCVEEENPDLFAPMLHHILTADRIELDVECRDWREAVRLSASRLLRDGVIEKCYVESMIHNIEENGPYVVIYPGFAMPHDAADAGTLRVGMNLIRLKEPVLFGDEEAEPVRYVCCLSAVDHERHLKAFFHLVNLLQNSRFRDMLERCGSPKEMADGIRKFEYELEV